MMPRRANPSEPRPEAEPVATVRCRILGRKPVHGHEPGRTVDLALEPGRLNALIQAGLVEVVAEPANAPSVELANTEKENGDGQVGSA